MNIKDNICICIDNYWFDVTEYASKHPGGIDILRRYHMKDATDAFNDVRGHGDALHLLGSLEIHDRNILKILQGNLKK